MKTVRAINGEFAVTRLGGNIKIYMRTDSSPEAVNAAESVTTVIRLTVGGVADWVQSITRTLNQTDGWGYTRLAMGYQGLQVVSFSRTPYEGRITVHGALTTDLENRLNVSLAFEPEKLRMVRDVLATYVKIDEGK